MKLSNEAYDILKKIELVYLPALVTLYVGLAQIWDGIPYAEQIAGTVGLIEALIGTLLSHSSKKYWEEEIEDGDNIE